MIRTVVFDIGNVLMTFDWRGYVGRLFDDPATAGRVGDAIWGHGLWEELDRGVWSYEEVVAGCIARAPDLEREIRLAFEKVGGCARRRDYAIPWIRELKGEGLRVLYLSNYSRLLMDANPRALDFLPFMDGGVFSCDVRLMKPDPAIYAELCEACGVEPAEAAFIDDVAANVEAAAGYGLHAIQFQSYEQACGDLRALLAGARHGNAPGGF